MGERKRKKEKMNVIANMSE